MSNSLRLHKLQHARPPCPSPAPRAHPNPCPSNQWCHPTISSSVVPFSSCPQSFPASRSFPMSQLFAWGGQSTGVSALASLLPKKHPGLISFRMDWLDLLAVQGTLMSLLQHHCSKHLLHSHQLGNSRGLRRSAKHDDKDQICISYHKSQDHKMYDHVIHQNCFQCVVFMTTIKMSIYVTVHLFAAFSHNLKVQRKLNC